MKTISMLDLKLEYAYLKNDIDAAIEKCLDHQKWILGPEVKGLEKKISEYLAVKHCVGVSSGTDALVLALRALAIKTKGEEYFNKNDKIITTSWTFTATGDAILRAGATPMFVDILPDTFNISSQEIKKCLSQTSGVVGILPVHLYGQSCDMDSIMQISEDSNLFVVEDVAQAFGGEWKGKKLGTIGDLGTFSFFPSKNLGGFGDGGMVSTNADDLYEIIEMLRKHGGKDKYNVDHIGYNARLDALQAAILLAKMNVIDESNTKRQRIAQMYNEALKDCKNVRLPTSLSDAKHVYHQYTIRITNGKRDEIRNKLKENGIETMVYYPVLLHQMGVFEKRCGTFGPLTESQRALEEVLSLPIGPFTKEEDVGYICGQLKGIL